MKDLRVLRVLIIGPLPPAVGGIATIMGTLHREFSQEEGVNFLDSSKPNTLSGRIFRPVNLLSKVVIKSLSLRGGKVLIFSSAYSSFWEKCLWALICRLSGARVVLEMVDGNFPRFYSRLPSTLRRCATFFMQNVEILAAQSYRWQLYYRDIFPHTMVKTVSAGIDTDFFTPAVSKTSGDPLRVIYVGWMIEEKGIYDLLEAAYRAVQKGFIFSLRLIGPSPDNFERIKRQVQRLALASLVTIVGPITSRKLLLEEYQSADIFAFPSHFEGFPFALIEAASTGLACIGTNVGGVPDILDEGRCGLLVEKQDPAALTVALCRLLESQELCLGLGRRARERTISHYTLAKSFESYRELLSIESREL